MSRVERHKDEYSKEDRKAVENSRAARTGGLSRAADPAPETQAQPVRNTAGGRAARNQDVRDTSKDDLGVWDQTEEEKKRARREARELRDGRPEFHGGRLLGKLISLIGTLILIVAIAACLGLALPRFAGIEQYVVRSGSMEPAVPVGSMVYSAQTEPSTLEAGNIIVFNSKESGKTPVTHRVVENHIADGEVITKGDANAQNDLNPVPYSDIIGKMVLHVPMLGYIAAPLGTMAGKIAMGCVIFAAYLLTVVGGKMSSK